jgi:hypothetical protein
MHAAHERIAELYAEVGRTDAYDGRFYDGPHKFDARMQQKAFAWLRNRLGQP